MSKKELVWDLKIRLQIYEGSSFILPNVLQHKRQAQQKINTLHFQFHIIYTFVQPLLSNPGKLIQIFSKIFIFRVMTVSGVEIPKYLISNVEAFSIFKNADRFCGRWIPAPLLKIRTNFVVHASQFKN